MNTRPIRFFHFDRGETVNVNDMPTTQTVLQWLRDDVHCTGTKEGCAEGDCGACTVLVAELAGTAGTTDTADSTGGTRVGDLVIRPVNACIQFLPTLDGKALLTVEGLRSIAGGALHPVQQALVECHGSQCGFCTPGIAVTLTSTYERHCEAGTRPTRQQLADDLAGNLCRCTGYRPILDAGQRMFQFLPARLETKPIEAALRDLQSRSDAHGPAFAYEAPGRSVDINGQTRRDRYWAPRDVATLAALREKYPDARLLAGSTDIGLWVNKQLRDIGDLIHVGQVAELRRIERVTDDAGRPLMRIGAAVTLEDAWSALASAVPNLEQLWMRFASPPVRHAGTLGGNLANGSPIGDGAPALMALDTRLVLRKGERRRGMLLEEFYLDYMKNALEIGEFVETIDVPLPLPDVQYRCYKLSKRFDSDISAVCAGLSVRLHEGRVEQVRFAFGGMAATVRRAACAEASVLGRPWSDANLREAMQALTQDFQPLTDMRASAAYRMRSAQNLLWRFWLETRCDQPLSSKETTVWSVMSHQRVARPMSEDAQRSPL
ncbi:xanthine dehydrogenase small subunit [Azohydromonas australica]|uniref:xanthine dehydrogenase small subunit n=1 Tax=Azohydromonas australica TaxID=364039 RepID=UPI00040E21F0|nr:xanthine dehydrogenase small subunit [Azohydromonas australica]